MHLTINSLNSLAQVLREAKPLYAECRFIINNLVNDVQKLSCPSHVTPQDRFSAPDRALRSEDDNRPDVRRVKNVRQHIADKPPSAKPTTEPILEAKAMIQELPRIPVSLMSRYDRKELYQKCGLSRCKKSRRSSECPTLRSARLAESFEFLFQAEVIGRRKRRIFL